MNIGLDMSKQNRLNSVDVASMTDFDATDNNSDTGSVAELEWNTWDDACAWEFRSAAGNFPPELDLNPPAELLRNNSYYTDDDGISEGTWTWGICRWWHISSSVMSMATA